MKLLNRLERMMGRHYIRDLMKYLVIAMVGVLILDFMPMLQSASAFLYFDRDLILKGQIWRLVTFIFLPPPGTSIWIFLTLYFYYFLGTALEHSWGSVRFNLYYLIGYAGALAGGLITGYATNYYLNLSLLLSFSVLNPEMEFLLFFFLPVKAKYLGMLWGAYLIYQLIVTPMIYKIVILLSLLPFILFFGKQAWLQLRMDIRRLRRWISIHLNK